MAKILVIEDDKGIRLLYKDNLDEAHDLDFAINGQEGFRRASMENYDLIIADLRMPDWSGAETVAALDMIQPDQKYLIVSAYLSDPTYQELLKDVPNIVAKLPKPFDPADLVNIVDKALA